MKDNNKKAHFQVHIVGDDGYKFWMDYDSPELLTDDRAWELLRDEFRTSHRRMHTPREKQPKTAILP